MSINTILMSLVAAFIGAVFLALVMYIQRNVNSKAAAQALSLITALAGSLVLSAADEVRTLKDPTKPGAWTPEEKARIKGRVLTDLKAFGADSIVQFKGLNGVTPESMEALLDRLVEQQVEVLRSKSKPLTVTAA